MGRRAFAILFFGVLSCPYQDPPCNHRTQETSNSFKIPPSVNPLPQPISNPPPALASPDSSHPHEAPPLQTLPTQTHPSTSKTETQTGSHRATQGPRVLLLLPQPGLLPLCARWGAKEPRSPSPQPGAPHISGTAGHSLTHPQDAALGGSPRAGGLRLGRRAHGGRKRQLRLPGCQARSLSPPPPARARHWSPSSAPPRGRARGSPTLSALPQPARLQLHVRPGLQRSPADKRPRQGMGPGSRSLHHLGANNRGRGDRTPVRAPRRWEQPPS